MIVDDSVTIRMSVSAMLSENGFNVVTANDGADALAKLGSSTPDLIISDLNMPTMDGMTFVRKARTLPRSRFTPILMLTTESDPTKRQAAKAAGATGWLVKPVRADALIGVIRQLVPGV
jgi:two-component system chemotaxis response regulator CheY